MIAALILQDVRHRHRMLCTYNYNVLISYAETVNYNRKQNVSSFVILIMVPLQQYLVYVKKQSEVYHRCF